MSTTAPVVDEARGVAIYYHDDKPEMYECLRCEAVYSAGIKHACNPQEQKMEKLPATTALAEKHRPVLSGFQTRAEVLKQQLDELMRKPEPWGAMNEARFEGLAQAAKILDDSAVTWLKAWETEGKSLTQPAYAAWKATTAFVARMAAGPEAARTAAKSVLTAFASRERRKAEELRRQDEARKLAAAQAERAAEIQHLMLLAETTGDEAYAEEVRQVEAEPIRVAPAAAPEPTKIEGVSTSVKKVAMVTDPYRFLLWLTASKDRCDAMCAEVLEWKQSGLNAMAKRGLKPDGVAISEVQTYTNRKRSEEAALGE